jgi:hypothetical protein
MALSSFTCGDPFGSKGEDSSGGGRNFHASGSYTRRGRDVSSFDIGAVATSQIDDPTIGYG